MVRTDNSKAIEEGLLNQAYMPMGLGISMYYLITRDLPGKCSGNDVLFHKKIDAAVKNVISFYFPTSLP